MDIIIEKTLFFIAIVTVLQLGICCTIHGIFLNKLSPFFEMLLNGWLIGIVIILVGEVILISIVVLPIRLYLSLFT